MNESKNNFQDLKQLLKLKQHEIPPPGYFNSFSGEVISRIRAGEAGGAQSLGEQIHEQVPWLANLLRVFETKPGVIGGFAVSLCLLLVLSVLLPDRLDSPSTVASSQTMSDAPSAVSALPELSGALAPAENSGIAVSTSPVNSFQPGASFFGQQQNPLFPAAQPASFTPSGQ